MRSGERLSYSGRPEASLGVRVQAVRYFAFGDPILDKTKQRAPAPSSVFGPHLLPKLPDEVLQGFDPFLTKKSVDLIQTFHGECLRRLNRLIESLWLRRAVSIRC